MILNQNSKLFLFNFCCKSVYQYGNIIIIFYYKFIIYARNLFLQPHLCFPK